MGALDYAHGVYGIGMKGKSKKHGKGFSVTGHIEEHLGC